MNRVACIPVLASIVFLAVSVVATMADDFGIQWSTINGGGEMWSAGGLLPEIWSRRYESPLPGRGVAAAGGGDSR